MGRELMLYAEKEETREFLSNQLQQAGLSLLPLPCPHSSALSFQMDPSKSRKDVMPFIDSLYAGSSL
jgi:hypothetical protein